MLDLAEHRLCPKCQRLLNSFNDKYLCENCWELFDFENTQPFTNKIHLCRFEEKKADLGVWFICNACGKSIMYTPEEYKELIAQMKDLFSTETIAKRRSSKEVYMKRCREEIETSTAHKNLWTQLSKLTDGQFNELAGTQRDTGNK